MREEKEGGVRWLTRCPLCEAKDRLLGLEEKIYHLRERIKELRETLRED